MLEDLTENEITLNDFINGVDVVEATCVDINTQRRLLLMIVLAVVKR